MPANKCVKCGLNFESEGTQCPACARQSGQPFAWAKYKNAFGGIFFMAVFCLLIWQIFLKGDGVYRPTEPALSVEALPLGLASVDDLIKEYKDNAGAADQKYGGKMMFVKGIITNKGQHPDKSTYILLRGEVNSNDVIRCTFPVASTPPTAACQLNQSVTVEGFIDPKTVGLNMSVCKFR